MDPGCLTHRMIPEDFWAIEPPRRFAPRSHYESLAWHSHATLCCLCLEADVRQHIRISAMPGGPDRTSVCQPRFRKAMPRKGIHIHNTIYSLLCSSA